MSKAEDNLSRAIDTAKSTVAKSGLPPVPRNLITDLPHTLDTASKRIGRIDESVAQAGDVQAKIARDLPADIPIDQLFDAYKYFNREVSELKQAARHEMPGGPSKMEQVAYDEARSNAQRQLFEIPTLKNEQRGVQTAMLAKGAVETAANRPHALTKMLSAGVLGGGNPMMAGAMLATDSPLFGSSIGKYAYKGANVLDAKALSRSLLLARIQAELAKQREPPQ